MTEQEKHRKQIEAIQQLYKKQMVAFGVIILFAGVIIGAGLTMVYYETQKPPQPSGIEHLRGRHIARLKEELQLTEDQEKQIKEVFLTHMQSLQSIREQARPQIAEEMNSLNEKVLEILDDNQDAQWAEKVNRLRKRFDPSKNRKRRRRDNQDGKDGQPQQQREGERRENWQPRRQDGDPMPGPGGPFDFWEDQDGGDRPKFRRRMKKMMQEESSQPGNKLQSGEGAVDLPGPPLPGNPEE